jgi:hypothetical protein
MAGTTDAAQGAAHSAERGTAAQVARCQARAAEHRAMAARFPRGHMDRLWYVGAARLEIVRARVLRGEYAPQG